MNEDDRRNFPRQDVLFAIRIDGKSRTDTLGISRNLSSTGVLCDSLSRFQVGDRLSLKWKPSLRDERVSEAQGTVVRFETHDGAGRPVLPYIVAIRFDGPIEEVSDPQDPSRARSAASASATRS